MQIATLVCSYGPSSKLTLVCVGALLLTKLERFFYGCLNLDSVVKPLEIAAFTDVRGNVTGNSFNMFEYNLAKQMVNATHTRGTHTYIYDGHNRRVKQSDSKGTSYSLYSKAGTLLYRETDDGGINYIYLGKRKEKKKRKGVKLLASQYSCSIPQLVS